MEKLICLLIVTSVMGTGASASIQPSQVTSGRTFTLALEANEKIQRYVTGQRKASQDLLIEILKFADELDPGHTAISERKTEFLRLGEEVGSQLKTLDSNTREELRPILTSLLIKHRTRSKNVILRHIMDRFWLWSPDQLDFMARMVRTNDTHMISTQLLWILDHATPEQRDAFFMQVSNKLPDSSVRWFPYALAFKYERTIDRKIMRRLLTFTNPEKLRPVPLKITLDGTSLPTTADLYQETLSRLQMEKPENICANYLVGTEGN